MSRQHADVRGIGVGVPGPVEFATGTPVAPPIMPGWYQRAVPLGTRSLRIVRSALDDRAGVIGAAVMVIEHVLAPDVVDRMLAQSNAA